MLRNVALSTNSVAASVEPTMHNQFLALSPGGSQFASSSNSSNHASINAQLMAHTPTTASMIAAMGDPFGTSGQGGSAFAFEPLSFSSHMDGTTGGGTAASAFDFTGHGMAMDVAQPSHHSDHTTPGSTGGGDSEMSSPANPDDGLVKVESA